MSTAALFDSPSTHARKRGPSSLRSLKAKTSRSSSRTSNGSKDSLFTDLLGIKPRHTPIEITDVEDSPTLKFSSSASIASGSTASTTSSASSSTSTATKASSISLTDHDLFGIKVRSSQEAQQAQNPNVVELAGQPYKLPEPIKKSFYRDLTFMEDEELIEQYGLLRLNNNEERDDRSDGEGKQHEEKTERD